MSKSSQERKTAQGARPLGYAKSRECDWRSRGINDASFTSFEAKLVIQHFRCPLCGGPVDTHSTLDQIMSLNCREASYVVRAICYLEKLKLEVPTI